MAPLTCPDPNRWVALLASMNFRDSMLRVRRVLSLGERMKMMNRTSFGFLLGGTLPFLALMACSSSRSEGSEGSESAPASAEGDRAALARALTLHASFDHGPGADFARGDPELYTAPSWDEADEAVVGIGNPDVQIVPEQGRFGSAIHFTQKNTSTIFYRAEDKVAYSENDWSGTISFWLNLSPDQDLAPGYCDPIQVTDQSYNDAAIWVDFTNTDPRQFRLGVFGDLESWNPDGLSSDEHPGFGENLVVVENPPFQRGDWTHVSHHPFWAQLPEWRFGQALSRRPTTGDHPGHTGALFLGSSQGSDPTWGKLRRALRRAGSLRPAPDRCRGHPSVWPRKRSGLPTPAGVRGSAPRRLFPALWRRDRELTKVFPARQATMVNPLEALRVN